MKLVSFLNEDAQDELAIFQKGKYYSFSDLDENLPNNMTEFLWEGDEMMQIAKTYDELIKTTEKFDKYAFELEESEILSPVPHPTSCRDGYAFHQHVEAARRNRGVEMIPEFYQYPIFYFTNHNSIQGPGDINCMPDHFQNLDFELEIAVVLGKQGMNITAAEADEYIAGFMIMNDMSARVLQMEEMKLNLGPAKGKDFSTILGPIFVTPDELEPYLVPCAEGHVGKNYNLEMTCHVNGVQVSKGNVRDMQWTFAEIIERCAYGTEVFPGDVIGSGTVGTGCFLELNGTGKRLDPNFTPQWLQPNDVVELSITGLGKLKNTIRAIDSDFSILKLKKNV